MDFHITLECYFLCLITVSYLTFFNWCMSYLMQLQVQSREDFPMYSRKGYGGVKLYFHSFLTSVAGGSEWPATGPGCFHPGGRSPRYPLSGKLFAAVYYLKGCKLWLLNMSLLVDRRKFKMKVWFKKVFSCMSRAICEWVCLYSVLQNNAFYSNFSLYNKFSSFISLKLLTLK